MNLNSMFPPLGALNTACFITSAGAVASLAALACSLSGMPRLALSLIFVSVLTDRLDGFIARKLGQTSEFGKQLDSLVDAFCFGFVPVAMLAQQGPISAAFFFSSTGYLLCVIWRLAFFNTVGLEEGRFKGIPTTVVGATFFLVECVIHIFSEKTSKLADFPEVFSMDARPFFLSLSALLMVSGLQYRKEGAVTKLLTAALPAALASLWLL